MFTITLAHLLARAGRLTPHEAVAIVQMLAVCPAGLPTLDNVEISSNGTASYLSPSGQASVADVASFLDTLLPPETRIPPALRYTIARGMGTVEAPPFVSVDEFSAALHRFEALGREQVIRNLLRRAIHDVHIASAAETLLGVRGTAAQEPVNASTAPIAPAAATPALAAAAAAAIPAAVAPVPAPATARVVTAPAAPLVRTPAAPLVQRRDVQPPTTARAAAVTSLLGLTTGNEVAADVPPHVASRARAPRWGAIAAAVALLASAATGYAFVEFRQSRHATPSTVVERQAVTPSPARSQAPAAPATGQLQTHDGPAALESAQPMGTTGRVVPPETPAAVPVPAPEPAPSVSRPPQRMRILRAQTGPAFSPAFSADGAALFFQTGTSRDPSSAIAMLRRVGTGPDAPSATRIVDDGSRNYHAQPSPDGRTIAFDSDRDGERGVYVAQADGSDVHRISGPGYAAVPTWSPDGTRVTYVRAEAGRPSVWNLWIQPAHGGAARRLTKHSFGQMWSASWFPDGRRICYAHEDSLIVLDVNTGRTQRIASPVKAGLVRTPAVSPDGRRIVFQVFHQGAWILNLADGRMEHVLTDPTAEEFAWAPDGRIAFHSRRDGEWAIYLLEQG